MPPDRRPAANAVVLTDRQEQILAYIGQGLTNREIGDQLGLAEQTVKNAVTDLLAVLGVRRRVDAAVVAVTGHTSSGDPVGSVTAPHSRRAG